LSEKLDQTKGKVKTKLVEYGQNLQTYSTGTDTPFNILVANLILASLDKILTLSIMAIS
jgi:hypothetical protein